MGIMDAMETGGATPRAPWDIREHHVVASAPPGSYARNKVSHSTRWGEGSNGSDKRRRWSAQKPRPFWQQHFFQEILTFLRILNEAMSAAFQLLRSALRHAFYPRDKLPDERLRCFIMDLPPELILQIGEHLPPHSRLLLSHTCSALHQALGRKGGARLSREDHIEYLIGVAYDLPTKWVCVECATLHDFAALDFPWSSLHTSCPLGWRRLSEGSAHTGSHSFMIHHRHVQIALKHKRLGASSEEHQQYVEALLAPRVTDFTPFSSRGGPNALRTRYAMIPRIIDGRFYVLGLWQYQQKQHAVSIDTMGDLNICAHSSWASFDAPGCTPRHDRVGPGGQLGISVADTRRRAMMSIDGSAAGCCSLCPTDFFIIFTPQNTRVLSWMDLGDEKSFTSSSWKSLITTVCRQVRCQVHDPRYGGHAGAVASPHDLLSVQKRFDALIYTEPGGVFLEADGSRTCIFGRD